MKVLLIALSLIFISCEQPSNTQGNESDIKSNSKTDVALIEDTISLTDLGLYEDGFKQFNSGCRQIGDTETYIKIDIIINDDGTMRISNEEYYNETCSFPSGAATVGHHYNWHLNFEEVDGTITATVNSSRMTTFNMDEINDSYCSGDYQGAKGMWADIDYGDCYEDRTGDEIVIKILNIENGEVEIDGVIYTVN